METLEYIYKLGIIYIVFSIIWFFFTGLPRFFSTMFNRGLFADYSFKFIQYYFIASLTVVETVLFVENSSSITHLIPFFITLGGIVIFLYLAGKTDQAIMKVHIHNNSGKIQLGGALKYEPHIVGVIIILYFLSFNFPFIMHNNVTQYLHKGILNFYNTFFIHFVISVVGFFFLISMFVRGAVATGRLIEVMKHIITGKPLPKRKQRFNPFQNIGNINNFNKSNSFDINNNIEEDNVEDEFIDFEEIEEDNNKNK